MSNNYALITGASSGIGLEIAKCLAEKKYNVILTARSEKKLIQFSSEISQNYGVKSDYIKCDLSEKDAPKMLYDFCESNDYQIDIKKFITRPTHMVWGDAVLKVKNKAIYFAKDLQVGLFENLTWDYGKDPAVDPF